MIKDFADWFSPMLVKELRQGMRSRVLTTSLFLLQGLLILNVIAGFGVAESDADQQATTGFFWAILALPLLLILPFTALGSVGNEIKGNTLELIFLTRLTARRIVFGKWIAVVAQALLLAVTVLPYVALRYYLGAVDVANELRLACLMLIASALLSALTVALSSFQSKVLRIFMGLGFFFSLQSLTYLGAILVFGGSGGVVHGAGWMDWKLILGLFVLVPLFIALMLEVGTIRIAPQAENHAGPVRLLALVILLVCGTISSTAPNAEWVLIVGQVLITPFCMAALCENLPSVPSLYRPFVRRGIIGKLAARFFTPGWPSGFLYTLLMLAFLGFFWVQSGLIDFQFLNHIHASSSIPKPALVLSLFGFVATLLFPTALISSASRKRFMFYIAFIALTAGAFFVAALLSGLTRWSELIDLTILLPPVAIFAPAFPHIDSSIPLCLLWIGALIVLSLVAFPFRVKGPFRQIAELEKQALEQLNSKPDVA